MNYRGEWKVFFKLRTRFEDLFSEHNELNDLEMENELAPFRVGDAVAQALLHERPNWEFYEVDELNETDRGSDGGLNRDDKIFTV